MNDAHRHIVGEKWSNIEQIRGGTSKGRDGEKEGPTTKARDGAMAPFLKRRNAAGRGRSRRETALARWVERSVRALIVSRPDASSSCAIYDISLLKHCDSIENYLFDRDYYENTPRHFFYLKMSTRNDFSKVAATIATRYDDLRTHIRRLKSLFYLPKLFS